MVEESWLSIILKVISGTEAKERAAIKAVSLYPQKSSGKAEGSSGDCMASGMNKNLSLWWGTQSSAG